MDQFRRSKIIYSGAPPSSSKTRRFFLKNTGRVILFTIFFFIAAIGVWYLAQWDKLQIREVRIMGLASLSEEEVRLVVMRYLEGDTLFFVPRNHLFAVSPKNLKNELYKTYPKIAAVEIKKNLNPALAIKIAERIIWGIGCTKTEVEEITENVSEGERSKKAVGPCFYIDQGGFAFEEVSLFKGGLFPILYKDKEGIVGSYIFSEEEIKFFEKAGETLISSLNFPLLSVEFLPEGEDARLTLKDGWSLFVPLKKSPSEWLPVLRTLLLGEIKERKNQLEYVDLRFGNKVFYKFR